MSMQIRTTLPLATLGLGAALLLAPPTRAEDPAAPADEQPAEVPDMPPLPDLGFIMGGDPVVLGGMPTSSIHRIVRENLDALRNCYQDGLVKKPKLAGKVEIRFIIADEGQITTSELKSSTLGNKKVETCMVEAIKGLAFPEPRGGGIVIVTYPFLLSP